MEQTAQKMALAQRRIYKTRKTEIKLCRNSNKIRFDGNTTRKASIVTSIETSKKNKGVTAEWLHPDTKKKKG